MRCLRSPLRFILPDMDEWVNTDRDQTRLPGRRVRRETQAHGRERATSP